MFNFFNHANKCFSCARLSIYELMYASFHVVLKSPNPNKHSVVNILHQTFLIWSPVQSHKRPVIFLQSYLL